MPLDPQAKLMIDQANAAGIAGLNTLTPAEARRVSSQRFAIMAEREEVAKVENRTIAGPGGPLPIRIYTPSGTPPFPVLVFYHGGGWVIGDLESHDALCRSLTNAAGCVTVAVDYRLAPEAKFPAAAEDCYSATCWVAENASSIRADASRLAIAGDSAGGNLAAAVPLMARDRGGPAIIHQLLIYPATDPTETHSHRECGEGYLLTRNAMHWFWNHYLQSEADLLNPYACPLRASSLKGLPPALVITAEYDPLRDEGEAYAARLKEAGVPVVCTRYDGQIHGFFSMTAAIDAGRKAQAQAATALRAAFALSEKTAKAEATA